MGESKVWRNRSPGDLSVELPDVHVTPVAPVIAAAEGAFRDWAGAGVSERIRALREAHRKLEANKDALARGISLETGKPIREAVGEVGAVLAKFDLTFKDAERYLADEVVSDGPHPGLIRRRPRGVAAVVGPFNFPLHLAHGALVPHLAAGNTVVFKPSPLAASVAGTYAALMAEALPPGVFGLVQGGGDEGWALCSHRAVRSVSFTGSVPVGKRLATALAGDLGKDVALELGGKNAVIVAADADLDLAAENVAEAMCLTAGQRCNATSRVLVDRKVAADWLVKLKAALAKWQPGDPLDPATLLGPVVSQAAYSRYEESIRQSDESIRPSNKSIRPSDESINWIVPGRATGECNGRRGHYVLPAVAYWDRLERARAERLFREEVFAPVLAVAAFDEIDEAIHAADDSDFGLTCSVFTRARATFDRVADRVRVGNVYLNLPTTFSPSTLPFGGWKDSGNHHPGGRGFIRFATDEQSVQTRAP